MHVANNQLMAFNILIQTIIYFNQMKMNNISVSKISVQSAKLSVQSKYGGSTQPQQGLQNQYSNNNEGWEQNQSYYSKHQQLRNQISRIQKSQEEMEVKYNRYIQHLLRQIEKNNENNALLAQQVSRVRDQISQSKKDILIIDQYVKNYSKIEIKKYSSKDIEPKRSSNQNKLESISKSKNLLSRRTPGKLFKSKLSIKV